MLNWKIVRICLIALVILVAIPKLTAQGNNGCACPAGAPKAAFLLDVCYGGSKVNVTVTYCTQAYTVPTLMFCGLALTNQYTYIEKICQGTDPLPIGDPTSLMKAVLCALSPTGGDALGIKALIPVAPGVYCWTIARPRCLRFFPGQGCYFACPETECCVEQFRFSKDATTAAITTTLVARCTTGDECQEPLCVPTCNWDPESCTLCP